MFVFRVRTAVESIEAQCAKYAKCPPCKNPLEAYSTCNNECLNGCYEGEAPSCPSVCEEGCFCKLGYKRYKDECVPEDKCVIAHTCSKPNEAFTDCGNRCIEKCGNRVCTKECQAGCFCIDGYKRNSAGDCVPEEKCCANPSCNDPNEEYTTCGNNCGESCNTPDGWMCPAVCKTGCFCRKGYKRHPITGQCIPEKECPIVCENPNEEYYCGNKCQEICGDDDRVCTDDCQLGCFCRKGFKRDPVTGQCICEKECPSACKDPNEVYTNCGNRCQEKCGDDDRVCTEECQIGCFCKKGFYRNYAGICVPKENCTSCKDPNEEYTDCGTGCGEACGYENVWCKERCREGCFCRKGYKRHPITGQCVPEKECPKDSTCCKDPNEEWNENGDRCSEPCDREVLDCAPQEAPGCYCKKGYLRDQVLGICVPQEQCPLIGDNLHCDETTEEYRCGNRCWDYCEDGAIRDCLMDCRYGCHCKEGYKYDPQKKKCVKKEECPYCKSWHL
ncbi:zonadhesin-like [Culicoides brevitarsis]|uniref:zonadhesin-like n=1 Tax=Culicoides brevitarsis TaxID=469753 RepID=UPI00307B30FA